MSVQSVLQYCYVRSLYELGGVVSPVERHLKLTSVSKRNQLTEAGILLVASAALFEPERVAHNSPFHGPGVWLTVYPRA